MIEINSKMRYNLSYQHKDLIKIGIIKIGFISLMLYVIYIGIVNIVLLSDFLELLLFIIVFALLEPVGIYLGISDIFQGRKNIILEIDGVHIRKLENGKLKIKATIKELKEIIYTYTEPLEWKEISFHLSNKKKIRLTITEKKEFPKIEEFFKFLVYYSKKYKIPFEEIKLKHEFAISC